MFGVVAKERTPAEAREEGGVRATPTPTELLCAGVLARMPALARSTGASSSAATRGWTGSSA